MAHHTPHDALQRMHDYKLTILASVVLLTTLSSFFVTQPLSSAPRALAKTNTSRPEPRVLSAQMSQEIVAQKYTAPTPTPIPSVVPQAAGEWGIAKQVDEHTWTMKVGQDQEMGQPQEILTALNSYRQQKGRGTLQWDGKLASYAQERANLFASKGDLDGHAGFQDFMNNDGFNKVGFYQLGENSSYGYNMEAVHLIEWIYAGDKPHDDNQLNPEWSHVGVGVNGVATNLIFGGSKQ